MRGVSSSAGPSLGRLLDAGSQHLSNLHLRRCPELLTPAGLSGIFEGLGDARLHALRWLDLDRCNVQPDAGPALGALLARCPRLQELRLGSNPALLTPEGLRGFLAGLGCRGMPSLSVLHLGDCDIQPAAAESLGMLFARHCKNLTTLSLSKNRFITTSDGLAGIEKGLQGKGLPALQELLVYRTFNMKSLACQENLRQKLGAPPECSVRA
jgi:Ran GTPase-activating protein (RanGAP) involved in mRNA processing and transport